MAVLRWFFAVAVLLSACGGPQFDGQVYRGNDMAFRVGPLPAGWRKLEVSHALLAFRDDESQATVAVNGRCGKDGDDVPLKSLTHHLFLHFTDRQLKSQETLTLDGRDALRTEIVAELDGVPKLFTVYVLKKDGCVYDFMHISEGQGRQETRQDFERFVRGFATQS